MADPTAIASQAAQVKKLLEDEVKPALVDVNTAIEKVGPTVTNLTEAIAPLTDALKAAAGTASADPTATGTALPEPTVSADDEGKRLATAYRAAKKKLDENTDVSTKSELETQLAAASNAYTEKGFNIASIDEDYPDETLGGRRRSRRSRRSRRPRSSRRSQISRRPRRPIRSRRSRRYRR